MKRLRWLITAPLALILIVFAINNRHLVDVSLWPLDFIVRWPLFLFVYIGVFGGFLAGAIVASAAAAQRHHRARQRHTDKGVQLARAPHSKDKPQPSDGASGPPAVID